jgi:glycosyltransferase involved in cell wall biosynthesis
MPVKRPKAMIVHLSMRFGGASTRALNLLKHFPPGTTALAGLEGSPVVLHAREQGSAVYTVGRSKADPFVVWRLARAVNDFGAQVVDTFNVQSKLWGSHAAARAKTALVSTMNSWYRNEHGGGLKGRFYQAIESATNRNLDLYVCISKDVRDQLLRAGISPEIVELIPNAHHIEPASLKGGREWLLQEYRLPADAVILCAVGRLVWAKGFDDLVAAFERLANRFPNLFCLIVGGGKLRENLSVQIQRARLNERVRLLGHRQHNEAVSIMNSSDVFVMPSRSEGTPVALLEAATLAKPILATRAGGIPEIVAHEEQALLVDVGDAEGLANGIAKLVTDRGYALALGQRAKARADEHFGIQAQVEATLRAYAKAYELAEKRVRRPMIR